MLSALQTPNPLVLQTHAAAQEGCCGPGWFFWHRTTCRQLPSSCSPLQTRLFTHYLPPDY